MPSAIARLAPLLCLIALAFVASCSTTPESGSPAAGQDDVAGSDSKDAPSRADDGAAATDSADGSDDAHEAGAGTAGSTSPEDQAAHAAASEAAAERAAMLMSVAPGELVAATDLSAAPDGSVYVVDEGASRIVRYAADGTLLDMWGAPGTAEGQFAAVSRQADPEGSQITVGPSGVVFMYDSGNERVQKFTAGGQYYTSWPAHASDMAVSPIGTLFLVDHTDGLIKHYCPAGRLKGTWGEGGEDDTGATQCGPYDAGTLYRIAVAQDESVIVADPSTGAVDRCTRTGELVESWELPDSVDGSDAWVGRLALHPDGPLLVTAVGDEAAAWFTISGDPTEPPPAAPDLTSPPGSYPLSEWMRPFTVAPDGSVHVLAMSELGQTLVALHTEPGTWHSVGARSTSDGQFLGAAGFATSPDGTVVVADSGNDRLQRFSATGQFIEAWGATAFGLGELADPLGVAVGPDGATYVADSGNHRVRVFDPTGEDTADWGGEDSAAVRFSNPQDVVALPDGSVAVVDAARLQLFRSDGTPIDSWDLPIPEVDPASGVPVVLRRQLAVDSQGAVLIADTANAAVWRVEPGADDVQEWLRTDRSDTPESMAVLADGSVVLSTRGTDTPQRYSDTGERLGAWPSDDTPAVLPERLGFRHVASAGDGGLYVTQGAGVQRLDADGRVTHSWGSMAGDHGEEPVAAVLPPQPSSDAWTMQVFDNPWLAGVPVTTTQVADIDLDWGLDAPVDELLPNGWSARLERELHLEPGQYDFAIASEGAVRLWLGDEIVADLWERPTPEWNAPFVTAGPVFARLDFADRGGPASVRLEWQETDP